MDTPAFILRILRGTGSLLVLWCLLLLPWTPSGAQDREQVPEKLPGATLVLPSEARALLGKARFIDTRILHDYLAGHLPDAIHIPYKEASVRSQKFNPEDDDVPAFLKRLGKFVPDKSSALVFYCNGLSCWKSYKAAKAAIEAGYTQVHWLREGLAAWRAQGFDLVQE